MEKMGKFNKTLPRGNKNGNKSKTGKVKRRRKLTLEFDEKQREEYLTGFRKRKNERRQKAKDEIQAILKMEKKRIKKQKEDDLRVHLEECVEALRAVESKVVELPNHTVTVTELDAQPTYNVIQDARSTTTTTEKPQKIISSKKKQAMMNSVSKSKKKSKKIRSSKTHKSSKR